MQKSTILPSIAMLTFLVSLAACDVAGPSSDAVQSHQQERLLQEGTAQVGMPAIKNFRERKLLKDIIEMRDQANLTTYTYLWSDVQGKWVFFCNSIGYGLPYSTQFTNPQKIADQFQSGYAILPQADPNGLFSPSSADGTWVLCKDPNGDKTLPVLIEPRCIVSPFELDKRTVGKTEEEFPVTIKVKH